MSWSVLFVSLMIWLMAVAYKIISYRGDRERVARQREIGQLKLRIDSLNSSISNKNLIIENQRRKIGQRNKLIKRLAKKLDVKIEELLK